MELVMNCEFGKVDFIQVKDKDVTNLSSALKVSKEQSVVTWTGLQTTLSTVTEVVCDI